MALRAQISFKETVIDEVELYMFLKRKAEIIGDSGYMKTLLKREKDKEEKEKENE